MNIAIILASGSGVRFLSDTPKQFMKLAGKTVLEHTIDAFEFHSGIDEVILVISASQRLLVEDIVNRAGYRKVLRIVNGGDTRQESTRAGIGAVVGDAHKVLVHDAVRPLLDSATIDRCLEGLDTHDCIDTVIPPSDTIVQADDEGCIDSIPERARLRLGQTPQGFRSGLLRKAHELATTHADLKFTDDCGLVVGFELAPIKLVAGDVSNIKITYPSDIYLADRLFQLRTSTSAKLDELALSGKVVVVFGASRGIGQEVAAIARRAGGRVVAVSRHDGVDVADATAVRRVLEQARTTYGRVDMVVNTAGVLRTGLLVAQDYDSIDEQLLTNLRGSIVVAREAFEVLKAHGGAIALFTSSSYTRGRSRSSVYSATKAAIVNLTQALAQEYLSFGVRINAINPERTATPMRTENFGSEQESTLLDAHVVASATLAVALSSATGEVVDVRK